MTTPRDYQVGTAAALKIAQAAINQEVPDFFRDQVPMDKVQKYVAQVAQAVVDAVDADRAKQQNP
jgi:hypothetical protein